MTPDYMKTDGVGFPAPPVYLTAKDEI